MGYNKMITFEKINKFEIKEHFPSFYHRDDAYFQIIKKD